MHRTPLAVLGLGLAVLLGTATPGAIAQGRASHARASPADNQLILVGGRAVARRNPFLPGPEPPFGQPQRAVPMAHASSGPTVSAVLEQLEQTDAIPPAQHAQYLSQYEAARDSLPKLTGTRHTELGAVLANVQAMAAAGELTPSRLPAVFLTLQRNEQWWTTGPLLSADQRVGFPGSDLVWQYYPGQGIEIQWLATFGEANGYWQNGRDDGALQDVLDQAISLASQRAGGLSWDYLFRFDGGAPPWTSGLSQGTAIQALVRAYQRLGVAAFQTAAAQALGIFQTPPPQGVRVQTANGAEYAEYSFAPGDRILNGFIQALVGLYDYTQITGDPLGQQLFEAGDAEARVEVPSYDTGYWSMYDQYTESDLNYHELLIQFLSNLCQRTSAQLVPGQPAGATGASGPTGANPGGTPPDDANPDSIYCTTASHFSAYLAQPPLVVLAPARLQGGQTGAVRFSLSKISYVTLTVSDGSQVMYRTSEQVGHGDPSMSWTPPARAGVYQVTLAATDLAGNRAATKGTITVTAPPKPKHRRSSSRPPKAPSKPPSGSQPPTASQSPSTALSGGTSAGS